MLTLRRAADRGRFDHGWLDTRHTFSFASYYDPQHVGFRALRVINEDRVAPGKGFATHRHEDMEILSYVLQGRLEHKDSSGGGAVLEAGELQRMSAGSGVAHSEFNPSSIEPVHFYQVWIQPARRGGPPGYEQRRFDEAEFAGGFRIVASPDGRDGSLRIGQDASVWLVRLLPGGSAEHALGEGRGVWLQVLRGSLEASGVALAEGDGLAVEGETSIRLMTGDTTAEAMLFDLA